MYFDTIYIGGGTPSILEPQLLEKLLKSIKNISGKPKEFTIEANPESITNQKLSLFLKYGINRLSIGIQSFNDRKLARLGRIHSTQKAIDSIYMAWQNGFTNISVDLIFGIWEETLNEWKTELKMAISLPIKHISCYSLSYEKRTKLFTLLKNKKIKPQDDEIIAEMYEYAGDYLEKNKFIHYEISNFAKAGFECLHNINYWQNNSYVGLGPSAVSYQRGVRAKNMADVLKYIKMVENKLPAIVYKEKISPEKQARETAAIKIRTLEGIDFTWFKKRTGFDFVNLEGKNVTLLSRQGLLQYKKTNKKISGVALTKKGFLFCDSISAQFL